MTCSWCNQKISFVRSLSDSRYCSDRHKKNEYEKCRDLAIQRLRNSPFFQRPEQKESAAAETIAAAQGSGRVELDPVGAICL